MGPVGPGFEFRVGLGGDKPGVGGQFDDFHDPPVRGCSGEHHPFFCQGIPVVIVYLIAVAVSFLNQLRAVKLVSP